MIMSTNRKVFTDYYLSRPTYQMIPPYLCTLVSLGKGFETLI